MTGKLISEDFEREHREMYRWFRSQQQLESLSDGRQRLRRNTEIVPVVLTEALSGETMLAEARRLYVRQPKFLAQIVSVGNTADDGTFTLTANGVTSADISPGDDDVAFQAEMDSLYGPGATTVTAGQGTWVVRQDSEGAFDLMTADASKLSGNQQVSIIKSRFNSVSPDKIKVFQVMSNFREETLPAGTLAWAVQIQGLEHCILYHNRQRPQVIMTGKTNAAIAAGSGGAVSIYRGTQDTTADLNPVTNISDQQADLGADVLILEIGDDDGNLRWALLPLDCPA